jgi:hypothetical protein
MMVRTALILGVCLIALPVLAEAPPAPYAGQQARTIKSLSAEDIVALQRGEGMGWRRRPNSTAIPALGMCWT